MVSLRKGIGYVDAVTISEKLCLLMIRSQNGHPSTCNVLEGTIHLLLHLNNSNRDLVIRLVLLPNLHIIYLIIKILGKGNIYKIVNTGYIWQV